MSKNYCLTFLILMLFINTSAQIETKILKTDSIISWSANNLIEWSDFKGEIDSTKFGNALTSYKIDIVPDNVMVDEDSNIQEIEKLTVIANFYKNHSWTTGTFDNNLLTHERLHFDIAELYARKIRVRFDSMKKKGEARFDVYLGNYKELWQECRLMQKQYDNETNHGVKLNKNKEWQKRIKTELDNLSSYK